MKRLILPFLGVVLLVAACRDTPEAVTRLPKRQSTMVPILGVDQDATMGALSGVARHIVTALRDPALRAAVAAAMKADSTSRLGLDLQDCDSPGVVHSLLAAGEKYGAGAAASVCASIKSRAAGALFMDPDRLRGWNGSTIPIVTAIENPRSALPATFHGYLSSERVIDLPADGSLKGPILVVLPLVHPHHNSYATQQGTARVVAVPSSQTPRAATTLIQPSVIPK